jgi:hypothetical protein
MATIDYARRNRALLSVYHYGRRQPGKRLHGRPVPLGVMPLHRAVAVLTEEPLEDHALHAIRLALGDLCRTRGGRRDSKIDRHIERMATAFSRLKHGENCDHAAFSQRFLDDTFAAGVASAGDAGGAAYQTALRRMLPPPSGGQSPAGSAPAGSAPEWRSVEDKAEPGSPASYSGVATIPGDFDAMVARLDPQRWHDAFPYIWTESIVTEPDYFVAPPTLTAAVPSPGSGGSSSPTVGAGAQAPGFPRLRSAPPQDLSHPGAARPEAPASQGPVTQGPVTLVASPPSDKLRPIRDGRSTFYEEALFGGYSFRNILKVGFTKSIRENLGGTAEYTYDQRACLDVSRDGLDVQGGIDVDSGRAAVRDNGDGTITVEVTKAIRFTKPALFVQELNDLAHVFLPMSLDSWIHGLIFSSPEEQPKQEMKDGKREEEGSTGLDGRRPEDARRAQSTVG